MATSSKRSRIPLFFAIGIGLSLLMAGLKAIAAWLAEAYLYTLPWVGGFLRSIELVEISNIVVFAILGVGIGSATLLLPRHWNQPAKISLLVVLSPFVFVASYLMQQHLWIQRVAAQTDTPYSEARDLTNAFLEREEGSGGFFGFFPFSTEVADLPTQREILESEGIRNPGRLLSEELASYNDPRADLIAYVFERVGWLMRLMYMAIAAFTVLIYYFRGYEWAEAKQQSAPIPPSPHKRP